MVVEVGVLAGHADAMGAQVVPPRLELRRQVPGPLAVLAEGQPGFDDPEVVLDLLMGEPIELALASVGLIGASVLVTV